MNKKWTTILIAFFVSVSAVCLVLIYLGHIRREKIAYHVVEQTPQERKLSGNTPRTDEGKGAHSETPAPPSISSNTLFKLDIGGGKSLAFKSQQESETWIRRKELKRLRDRGGDDQTAFVLQESWDVQDGQPKDRTLNDWLTAYNGKIFDPIIVFDAKEDHEPDFSTPISSLQSYWHAMHTGDAKTLLDNADRSALKVLKGHFGVDENSRKDTYFSGPCKKFTLFFSGRTSIGGAEYVLVFYRRAANTNPKHNRVSFHTAFFKRLDGRYKLSEAPRGSRFADVYSAMGAKGIYPAGAYQQLHDKLKKTAIPKHFYTLE